MILRSYEDNILLQLVPNRENKTVMVYALSPSHASFFEALPSLYDKPELRILKGKRFRIFVLDPTHRIKTDDALWKIITHLMKTATIEKMS